MHLYILVYFREYIKFMNVNVNSFLYKNIKYPDLVGVHETSIQTLVPRRTNLSFWFCIFSAKYLVFGAFKNSFRISTEFIQVFIIIVTSHWRHNVSNHRQINSLYNSLFRLTTKGGGGGGGGGRIFPAVTWKAFPYHGLIMCYSYCHWIA